MAGECGLGRVNAVSLQESTARGGSQGKERACNPSEVPAQWSTEGHSVRQDTASPSGVGLLGFKSQLHYSPAM